MNNQLVVNQKEDATKVEQAQTGLKNRSTKAQMCPINTQHNIME